jgi:hypothetical protein
MKKISRMSVSIACAFFFFSSLFVSIACAFFFSPVRFRAKNDKRTGFRKLCGKGRPY